MKKKITGVSLVFVSTVLYGFLGIISRYIEPSFGVFSQSYVRESITVLLLLMILKLRRSWKTIQVKDRKWFFLWAVAGAPIMLFLFPAFQNLTIGTVNFLMFGSILIAGEALGTILFNEKFDRTEIISLLISLTGLAVMFELVASPDTLIYIIYALIGGALIGSYNVFSKKISDRYSPEQIYITASGLAIVISIVSALYSSESLPSLQEPNHWYAIGLSSLIIIGAAFSVIGGFKRVEAQVGTLIMPLQAVFASLFGYYFFGEEISIQFAVGAVLIIIGSILPAFSELSIKR